MSINLVKGQKLSLKKEDGNTLTKVCVGLGWDPIKHHPGKGGFLSSLFGGSNEPDIDCDASVFLLKNGKLTHKDDIVCYFNLNHKSGAVTHCGDNLTGDGDGDDEQIQVDLSKVPAAYDRLVFVVNIYESTSRHQQFGMIENAFIRIVDEHTGHEFCKFNLSDRAMYDGKTGMIFGEIYRHNGESKISANGTGTNDNSITDMGRRYI